MFVKFLPPLAVLVTHRYRPNKIPFSFDITAICRFGDFFHHASEFFFKKGRVDLMLSLKFWMAIEQLSVPYISPATVRYPATSLSAQPLKVLFVEDKVFFFFIYHAIKKNALTKSSDSYCSPLQPRNFENNYWNRAEVAIVFQFGKTLRKCDYFCRCFFLYCFTLYLYNHIILFVCICRPYDNPHLVDDIFPKESEHRASCTPNYRFGECLLQS